MPDLAWKRCVRPKTTPRPADTRSDARSERSLLVQFHNAKLATPDGLVDGELWMQHGSFVDPEGRFWQRDASAADRRIDCKGMIIAPGFIDLHVMSACGVDFTSLGDKDGAAATAAAEREIERVCTKLPEYGVTAFCPTIRPTDPASYQRLRARLRPSATTAAARLVGLHFDGPFLSAEHAEAPHDSAKLRSSLSGDALAAVYGSFADGASPRPAIVTLAPERTPCCGLNPVVPWLPWSPVFNGTLFARCVPICSRPDRMLDWSAWQYRARSTLSPCCTPRGW